MVVSLEQILNKVQSRVEMLEQDQAKSKDAIKDVHDGLQALNTMVEASKCGVTRESRTTCVCSPLFTSCKLTLHVN